MPYPWVNTVLLGFVATALISGYLGLTNGDPGKAWILWVHGAVAYAIVAVAAWKVAVIWRSVRVHPVVGTDRATFLCMAVIFLVVLISGITWATAGRIRFGQVSLIEIHYWTAAAIALLLGWHVVARRWILRIPKAKDRRAFLRLAVGGAAGVVLWQGGEALVRLTNLPGADRRFTGSYETGSFTGRFPTVSWLNDDPERIDRDTWRLVLDGEVGERRELTYADIEALAQEEREATVDCTGGWYSRQLWSGVSLASLLALASPDDGAGSIEVVSVTGFNRRFSMAEVSGAMLALGVAGQPLTHGHGAPARLVMPDHRGFDWVKWVERITVHGGSDIWQSPLPLD